jgi:hypothetical protein
MNRHYPMHEHMNHHMHHHFNLLKNETLMAVKPFVGYGLNEAQKSGYEHAMTEVAAIAYLIGRGYHLNVAYSLVESWEKNEKFY